MANLNLSEFTEKLFVADADHTFIWDTANAISKRVSRNSWLNSGTLTSDAPVTISQTWNGTGSTVFKALVVNATTPGTTSSSSSLLLDLQVGTVSQVSVTKAGLTTSTTLALTATTNQLLKINASNWLGTDSSQVYLFNSGFGGPTVSFNNNNTIVVRSDGGFGWSGSGNATSSADTILLRDGAANTLALRNGAAAQTFRVYRSYLNAGVDYERLSFSHDGVQFGIGTERGGSGVAQPLRIFGGSSAALDFANGVSFRNASGGTTFMTVASSGNVGIGTTAPGSALHISGALGSNTTTYDSAAALKLTNTTGNSSWLLTSGVIGVVNASFSIRRDSVALPALTISGITDNVGIGTTSPTSKLQVTGGDVEIETVTSGIIMKAAGTATRYRITLNAGGTALVFTPI